LVYEWANEKSIGKDWTNYVITDDAVPIVSIGFRVCPGRALVKLAQSWFATFQCDLLQCVLYKCASKRDLALFQHALDAANQDSHAYECKNILEKFAATLPWIITIVKYGEIGKDPIEAVKAKTELDNKVAEGKGSRNKAKVRATIRMKSRKVARERATVKARARRPRAQSPRGKVKGSARERMTIAGSAMAKMRVSGQCRATTVRASRKSQVAHPMCNLIVPIVPYFTHTYKAHYKPRKVEDT